MTGKRLFSLILICLTLVFPVLVIANDYKEELARIRQRERLINQQLSRLGIQKKNKNGPNWSDGLEEERKSRPLLYQVHELPSRLQAPAGKLLYGRTLTRLVVGAEGSPAIITLNPDQGIFSGLRVLGRARQSNTPGRLQIDFDRIILRTGKSQSIKATALDSAGAFGLEAEVFSSKALAVTGAMGASFISGLAASQQTASPTAFGFSQVPPTGRNAILQGLAQTAADQSKRLIEEATQEKPVLVINPDQSVSVYVDEEVRF